MAARIEWKLAQAYFEKGSVMNSDSSFRLVISFLLDSVEYLDLYMLHEKYKLSPGQILEATTWLRENGYVEQLGTKARLTAEGREWLIRDRFWVFKPRERPWSEVPDGLMVERILPNEPYMPDLAQVQQGFFLKR